MEEGKNSRFKRLAKLRGERILKDIYLLGNLSNRNNYDYTEEEVSNLFGVLEEELKAAKARFTRNKRRKISF